MPAEAPINQSSPCSACGRPVGGGLHYCPRCKIALCNMCSTEMMWMQIKKLLPIENQPQNSVLARPRCPMCEEYFPDH